MTKSSSNPPCSSESASLGQEKIPLPSTVSIVSNSEGRTDEKSPSSTNEDGRLVDPVCPSNAPAASGCRKRLKPTSSDHVHPQSEPVPAQRLKHKLFHEPRTPRKGKSHHNAQSKPSLMPPNPPKVDLIDPLLREKLLDGPDTCVLDGSIAKLVLDRIGKLDSDKVQSDTFHCMDEGGSPSPESAGFQYVERDVDLNVKAAFAANQKNTYSEIRVCDNTDNQSDQRLLLVTKGPYRGLVGTLEGDSSIAASTYPARICTVRTDHTLELNTVPKQPAVRPLVQIGAEELFLDALKECLADTREIRSQAASTNVKESAPGGTVEWFPYSFAVKTLRKSPCHG